MHRFCHTILDLLEKGRPLALVTLMDQDGSAPRTAGARMLVFSDGTTRGTVGGGRYEAEAVSAGRALLAGPQGADRLEQPGRQGCVLRFSLAGVTDMDMVCGGSLSLLLEQVLPDAPTLELFTRACQAETSTLPDVFITAFSPSGGPVGRGRPAAPGPRAPLVVERRLYLRGQGLCLPPGPCPPPAVLEAADRLANAVPRHMREAGTDFLLEALPRPGRVLLFGAGHVSRALADALGPLEFAVTVLDDRPDFANARRFPLADVSVLPSLGKTHVAARLKTLRPGPKDGIVILTRGHAHDRDVLAAALETRAGYIGMIGSGRKREAVYASLRDAGVAEDALARVHTPVGLDIGAETPEEIAVSIAAELVRWKRRP